MNVNQKGVKGLIKVIDDLQEKGFYVFNAFDDHSPVDVIALDKEGNTYKIQIKYRETNKKKKTKNSYDLATSSVVNGKRVEINRDMIDGWAVYLANDNKVIYISKEHMQGKKMTCLDPDKDYGELTEWQCAGLLNQDH